MQRDFFKIMGNQKKMFCNDVVVVIIILIVVVVVAKNCILVLKKSRDNPCCF